MTATIDIPAEAAPLPVIAELSGPGLHRLVARMVLDRIRLHPRSFDQRSWLRKRSQLFEGAATVIDGELDAAAWERCGTAACVAGHVVAVGYQLGERVGDGDVSSAAVRMLGIDKWTADWLFAPSRPKHDVVRALAFISAGRTELAIAHARRPQAAT